MTSRVGFEWCWADGYYGIVSTILLRFIEDIINNKDDESFGAKNRDMGKNKNR